MNTFKQIQQSTVTNSNQYLCGKHLFTNPIAESHNIEVYIRRKNTQVHFEKYYINPIQDVTHIKAYKQNKSL